MAIRSNWSQQIQRRTSNILSQLPPELDTEASFTKTPNFECYAGEVGTDVAEVEGARRSLDGLSPEMYLDAHHPKPRRLTTSDWLNYGEEMM